MPQDEIQPAPSTAALLRVDWYKYCERGKEYYTPPHVHRYFQWYHVVRGEARVTARGQAFVLRPGQSVLFSPGSERDMGSGRRPVAYFAAVFEPRVAVDFLPVLDRVLEVPPEYAPDMGALVEAARRPQAEDEWLVQALVMRLLLAFKRRLPRENDARVMPPAASPLNRTYKQAVVARVELILKQHFHENLTREDVAGQVRLSPGHLARLYRTTTGRTLHDRITQLRIEAAKDLLLHSTSSITQIAMEVGYDSFSHFSKVFKALEGMSPGDFRRQSGGAWHETPL